MTENQGGMVDAIELIDQLIAVRDCDRIEKLAQRKAHLPHQWPTMPSFNFGRRTELTELRPRQLCMVEEYGFRRDYDRDVLRNYFTANWYRLFGPLRKSKALEVQSDQLRKELMVTRLLDLIEMRRAEYAEERAARSF